MTIRRHVLGFSAAFLLLIFAVGCGTTESKEDDFLLDKAGVPSATTMITVDSAEIPADLYYYWLGYSLDFMDFSRYNGEGIVWTDEIDGMSVADYVKNDTLQTIRLYAAAEQKAEALGCGFDESTQTALEAAKADYIDSLGGEEEYLSYLRSVSIQEQTFLHLITTSLLCDQLMDRLYGAGGDRTPTQDTIDSFCVENGLCRAKYICLASTDESGDPLPEAALLAQATLAGELALRLRESETPATLFEELRQTYSQDPNAENYPDGYVFSQNSMLVYNENYGQYLFEEGGMAAEIYAAAVTLEVDQTSDPIACGNDWYLLLRLPVPLDMVRDAYCQADFSTQLSLWKEETTVSFSDSYEQVNPQAYYDQMLATQRSTDGAVG